MEIENCFLFIQFCSCEVIKLRRAFNMQAEFSADMIKNNLVRLPKLTSNYLSIIHKYFNKVYSALNKYDFPNTLIG